MLTRHSAVVSSSPLSRLRALREHLKSNSMEYVLGGALALSVGVMATAGVAEYIQEQEQQDMVMRMTEVHGLVPIALALLWLSSHHPAKDFAPTWEKFSHAQQQHAILEATLRDWRTCATPGTQMRVASDQLPLPSYTPTLSLESVDMTPTML